MKKLLAGSLAFILILGGLLMISCGKNGLAASDEPGKSDDGTFSEPPVSSPGERPVPPDETENLAYGCPYFYDCGIKITGDDHLTLLTDGDGGTFASLETSLDRGAGYTVAATDWGGKSHALPLDNSTAAISVDLGFMASVTGFEVVFGEYSGKECEIFYSTDGYNFSFYAGKYGVYDKGKLNGNLSATAKSLMFVFPITPSETIEIGEIRIYGDRRHNRVLLSAGAAYQTDGTVSSKYPESETGKLTDGKTAFSDGEDAVLGITSSATDPVTGKKGCGITLDLGAVKDVSEVYFGVYHPAYTANLPGRITVRYSADGADWLDFGQSFQASGSGKKGSTQKYIVTRPYTVKARYLKIFTYVTSLVLMDEIYVYGSDAPVPEPDYDLINRKNGLSNTNVASFAEAKLNGEDCPALTDLKSSTYTAVSAGENLMTVEPEEKYDEVCGAALVFEGVIDAFGLYLDENEVECESYSVSIGKNTALYLFFDGRTAKKASLKVTSQKGISLCEFSVYAGRPQLPLVKGGFFQLQTNGAGSNASAQNSDYSWYLQLKGMKDLGMDYVVMQYSAHYSAKTTLVKGPEIMAAGYTYTPTYGSADLYEAVLSAADKLGMKVFLGTIHDSDFASPKANAEMYEYIVADSFPLIKDIYDMYHHHSSFAGYYLSDEECDYWLNMSGGVDAGRYVYKNQSDYIHEIAPEALVMIAPAIWRSGTPINGADNLYRLIAADDEGGRPVADIVAAQDCLGRLSTLFVEDEVYEAYEAYASEWARAVRRAGGEFWHDAEVFEQVSTTKRYGDLVKSLGIEGILSGTIIVFDIPHYFTAFPMASFDHVGNYYKRLIMRDYVKYYADFARVDAYGQDAEPVRVVTDDGRKVDISDIKKVEKPEIKTRVYNEGVLTGGAATFENADTLNWQDFRLANNAAKPQYAFSYDDENFYAVLRIKDTTKNYGKGLWWEGMDDLVQVWMSPAGKTSHSVLDTDNGIRYYLHRTQSGWDEGGSTAGPLSISGFSFAEKDGIIIITMPWTDLGRDAPKAGDGTAMGIKIQYIDGEDRSWASTDATKDQSVIDSALYSY